MEGNSVTNVTDSKKGEKMELKQTILFQNLNQKEIYRVLQCAVGKFLNYTKNQSIILPDDKPEVLYLILNGKVVIEQYNYMGKPMNLEYRTEGQIFGESDLFSKKERFDFSVRAVSDCKILTTKRSFFYRTCEKNCKHHSKIIFNMLHILSNDNKQKQQRLELLTCGDLNQRTAQYLSETAKGSELITLSMDRNTLSTYLNTTRPSLSRIFSNLQEDGIIKIEGRKHIRILDQERLSEIADGV